MPLNPSIALAARGVELGNPLERAAQVEQIRGAQQQNALMRMQMGQAESEMANQNRLREFLPNVNAENRSQLLGYGKGGREVYETLLKGEKDSREAEKLQFELNAKKAQQLRDMLPSVTSPEAYQQWRALTLQSLPGFANMVPEQYSPEVVQGLMMTADKALENYYQTQDLGGATRTIVAPKYGSGAAQVLAGSEASKTLAPGEAARLQNDSARLGLEARRVALAERKGSEGSDGAGPNLSPKARQKLDAGFAAATSATRSYEEEVDKFIGDLERLKTHPGLGQITGLLAGRIPGVTGDGRAAEALYDKIIAKGGFQALTGLKAAGGTLGAVSNQEGKDLKASFAAVDRRQDAKDVQAAIDQHIAELNASKARVRDAYEMTYEYKGAAAPTKGQQPAPKATATSQPIPSAAIEALRKGEGTREQFDALFGPGAAAKALGQDW